MTTQSWFAPQRSVTSDWLEVEFRADRAPDISRDERHIYETAVGDAAGDIVIYGAGNLGRRVLAGLRGLGVEPRAFADNSIGSQGSQLDGVDVLSPAAACQRFGKAGAFVVSVWSPSRKNVIGDIEQSLRRRGAARSVSFVALFWRHADAYLPYYPLDLPHGLFEESDQVLEAYRLFRDRQSQHEFLCQLTYLMSTMETFDIPRGGNAGYFPADLVDLSPREVFVDCGAYDGDTVASFLAATSGRFERIVAFEPDPFAVAKLRTFREAYEPATRNRIHVEQAALGASAGEINFDAGGTPGSRISDDGDLSVQVVTLDDALAGERPTFIKMDIEGAERDALAGAAKTIREHRPILAICVYHLQADVHLSPSLIQQLTDGYRLFLRRQGGDGDLVCYAIPSERLRRDARS